MKMAGKINPNIFPIEDIILLYQFRLTMRQIAQMCQCATSQICCRLKKAGVKTRGHEDYSVTEKQRAARRENGKKTLGIVRDEVTKQRISEAKKRYRKRDDYEFGGHEKQRTDGYVSVFVPDHPNATKDGFVMKHTLVMEQAIGRCLLPGEVVHHVNRVRNDNRLENLMLMTISEHNSLHAKERKNQTQRLADALKAETEG